MASYLKALNLTSGVEEVIKQIEVNAGGDISGVNTLNVTGGTNSIDLGETGSKGTLYVYNDNAESIDVQYSNNSTEDLQLRIKNTKATLDEGDILVYNGTEFEIDNISNYVSGTGNYHVLKVEFEANADFETATILPVGSQIDKIVIISGGLTTGIAPLQFLINGSTPLLLAEQGVYFDNSSGYQSVIIFGNIGDIILASGEEGTFKAEWSGAGFGTGSGYAYLFYWTPLP